MDQAAKEIRPELSLFLPVLDEEENLPPMHAKIAAALDALGKTAEANQLEIFQQIEISHILLKTN